MTHPDSNASRRTRFAAWRRAATAGSALALLAAGWYASSALAAGGTTTDPAPNAPVDAAPTPEGLKGVSVPVPSNASDFILSQSATVRLGKALFWDMQLGSDGKTACASCHFQAGADPRSKNQVSPGLNRMANPTTPNPDVTFQVGGPNYQFKTDDFPFHKFSNPDDRNSSVVRTHNDIASSQGVFNTLFNSVSPGASADNTSLAGDPVFQVAGLQTRRDEPRNAPTVINSIFNFRNFWDGRAQYLFNGATPFGALDTNARVYKKTSLLLTSTVEPVQIRLNNSSIASLATGPGLSVFEMSAAGRTWPQVGRRLLSAKPLALQKVASTDSVLGAYRDVGAGKGLNGTYDSMVKAAFKDAWVGGTQSVNIGGVNYTQKEANFSLFFGLAIQAYIATQVSDDSPFDKYMAGSSSAMSSDAAKGMGIFFGKGSCANCHGGAEFTNASIRKVIGEPMSRMVMGNGGTAVYDEGFYNTAVAKTLEDISNGAINGVGRPTSLTALAQQVGSTQFKELIGISANVNVVPGERIAVNGAFKTPTIRNVELTAPFFHNGDSLTLEEVVDFYNRGGNHFGNNLADVDPDIKPLGLSADEKRQLVEFMKATTDERVRLHKAPFDHPQLLVPNGHPGNTSQVTPDGTKAADSFIDIPEVGSSGYSKAPASFLESGLTASYFKNNTLSGTPAITRVEMPAVAVNAGTPVESGFTTSNWSIRWDGYLRPLKSGVHVLKAVINSDDAVRVWVGGTLVIDNWTIPSTTAKQSGSVALTEGVKVPIRVEFKDASGSAKLQLQWQTPGSSILAGLPATTWSPAP